MIATTTCLPSRIAAQRTAKLRTMVSTAVLPLVLMMTTAGSEYFHHRRYVSLPRTLSAEPQPSARREDVIKVSVSRDGHVFFRNLQMGQTICRTGSEKRLALAQSRKSTWK